MNGFSPRQVPVSRYAFFPGFLVVQHATQEAVARKQQILLFGGKYLGHLTDIASAPVPSL